MNNEITCPECGEPLLLIYEGKVNVVASLKLGWMEDLKIEDLLHWEFDDNDEGKYTCFHCGSELTRIYDDAQSLMLGHYEHRTCRNCKHFYESDDPEDLTHGEIYHCIEGGSYDDIGNPDKVRTFWDCNAHKEKWE